MPPDVDQRHRHQRDQRGEDHEELEHLVVDRRGQPAERDVDEHDAGGDHDRGVDRPAQHQRQHQAEREQVDAADQHGRDGEGAGVEEVGGPVVAPPQPLGHRAHLRPVVEGHHHQAEEDHGRDRADPVEVHGRHAVLGAVGRHPEDLERAEVGRHEGQPGDPRGQRAAREEEVEVRLHQAARGEADAHDGDEVDRDDRVVQRRRVDPEHGAHSVPAVPLAVNESDTTAPVDRRLAYKNVRTGLIAGAIALIVFALAWVVGFIY